MQGFKFEELHRSKRSSARVGKIYTAHGVIDTPSFVAVGTNGTLKAVDNEKLASIGLQLMFCNTYHLILQPGPEIIEKAGGLHKFINRKLPIITDSGGFQVFSLSYGSVSDELKGKGKKESGSGVIKITEEGVLFRSYRDGKKVLLTPESSIAAQKAFGSDIIIPLDELPPYHINDQKLKNSFDRTHRWEKRSLDVHLEDPRGQAIYSVIHGGVDPDLRKESCSILSNLSFDGHAIGGSVGRDKLEMHEMLKFTTALLPRGKPIHLLGIGDLESIDLAIPLGIDTFDSSYPTKAARHAVLLTGLGKIKITKAEYATHYGPIEQGCTCWTCTHFTMAYLHHLFKCKEIAGLELATLHNLHFMVELMRNYRERILRDEV